MCACWCGAEYVPFRELFQPACGRLERWPGHLHAGVPPPCVRVTGLLHTHAALGATSRVRVLARRSLCSPGRVLSTSPLKLGTSARLPTCRCAAALHQGHRDPAQTQLLSRAATSRVCVCWCGADHVLLRKRFQPAFGSMGRRPGHQHERAPPPCVRVTGLLHTHAAMGAT